MQDLATLLTGQSQNHIRLLSEAGGSLHRDLVPEFLRMREAAAQDGIDMRIYSGFRAFGVQLNIWNSKARGERAVLSDAGEVIDISKLPAEEKILKIGRWTAIPGSSRHHWGTDLDVIDGNAVPEDYRVQLTVEESYSTFGKLHRWLDEHMQQYGFFRPYARDLGGVHPEPWHISFAPLAERLFEAHGVGCLERALKNSEIELKEELLKDLPRYFERFFKAVDHG